MSCFVVVLFLTFSVLVANPKKLLYTVANPARGLLNREKRTNLLHIESNLGRLGMLSPTHDQRSQQKTKNYAPTSFDQQVQVSQGHTSYRNNKNRNTEVRGGGGLQLVGEAGARASIQPSKAMCILEKAPRILLVRRSLWLS